MNTSDLIKYNIWANRLFCKQIETLPQDLFEKNFGGGFGSMKATLIHVLESDWLWLNRWNGIPLADIPDWQLDTAEAVTTTWSTIQDEMAEICHQLADTTSIEFHTRKGTHHVMSLGELVAHISHHGSYHRGQLASMIRQAGTKPVSTDYFIFCAMTK